MPRFPLLVAAVCSLLVCGVADARAQERCGPYTVVHARGSSRGAGALLQLVDGQGGRAYQLTGALVRVDACEDLTGDKRPELIVSTYTGGQRCCTTFYVLALGQPIRPLLRWETGYDSDLEIESAIDPAGAKELSGRDDRLQAFGSLPVAVSPTLPARFCYVKNAFADCTRSTREALATELTEAKERLGAETNQDQRRATAVTVIALALLLDDESSWAWLRASAPDTVSWLEQRRAALTACMKTPALAPREQRLAQCTETLQ